MASDILYIAAASEKKDAGGDWSFQRADRSFQVSYSCRLKHMWLLKQAVCAHAHKMNGFLLLTAA